ncbi:MAG: phosphatase PAP2 family protein [Alistipes sp.]|nr:phosphatase PAP2 family protein [Alistipes sp.]
MNSITWDWPLFELLNFDGPEFLDSAMILVSSIKVWIPLYLLIIYMVWRRYSWRGMLLFLVAIGVAIGFADIVAGIFKHQGILKDLLPDFPARLRPMHTEEVEAFTNGYGNAGQNGSVSAHAATITAIALLSSLIIKQRWITILLAVVAILVCYSRIYLACHFPQDLLLGALLGIVATAIGFWLFQFTNQKLRRSKN